MNPSSIVYLVGIVIFGLFYEKVKGFIGGDVLFVGAAIAYLILLRLAGDFAARKWRVHKST